MDRTGKMIMAVVAGVAIACTCALSGCSSMPQVTPQDLDALTLDLKAVHQGVSAIDTSQLDPKTAHAIEDVKTVAGKAVTVSDLLSRVSHGAAGQ